MKIVILDGYAANPGDLSWDAIAALGELTVYHRTAPAEPQAGDNAEEAASAQAPAENAAPESEQP